MAISCNICNKELDAFSGGRCKICRSLVCSDCMASGSTDQKAGIICKNCATESKQSAQSQSGSDPIETETTAPQPYNSKRIPIIIIGSFTLLCIFIYLLTIPYITTQNAIKVIEFGPDKDLQEAKEKLSLVTGTYVLDQLEDLAINGKQNTAIRAVSALGAQPSPRAILILKKLQLSDDTPEYLNSIIIEALLENERLYKPVEEEEKEVK